MFRPSFKRFPVYFILCWLPGVLLTLLNSFTPIPNLIYAPISWLFSAVFVIGWCSLIAQLATQYPLKTFGGILVYSGVSVLLIAMYYGIGVKTQNEHFSIVGFIGGIVSYIPMNRALSIIKKYIMPHELVIVGGLVAVFLISWLGGAIQGRRVRKRRGF